MVTGLNSNLKFRDSDNQDMAGEYYKNVRKFPENLGIMPKEFGAFYTDKEIVTYILSQLDINKKSVILDPACGCGSFLFPLYEMANKCESLNLLNIYGIDIDERAISFTRNTIKSMVNRANAMTSTANILLGDFITNNLARKSSIFGSLSFYDVLDKGGFDYIIGNPPYNIKNVSKKKVSLISKVHREIANNSKNMPIYFILKGLELLREGGVIAFVLPKSLLYVKKYNNFRQYLLNNFKIIRIAEIGMNFKDVRGEQIIAFIEKTIPSELSEIEFITLRNLSKTPSFSVQQSYFIGKASIPVLSDQDIFKVINRVNQNSIKLSEFCEFQVFRGVSLQMIKIIDNVRSSNAFQPENSFIRGKDIMKAGLRRVCLFDSSTGSAPKMENLKSPKIILQNIYSSESGIISFLDNKGVVTSETVTNVLMPDYVKLKFFYAMLNSKLINFYLFNEVFSQSRMTMHVDGYYLSQIPIVWKENSDESREILNIADLMLNCRECELKELLSRLDSQIYRLYNLDASSIEIIEKSMSKMLSKRSKW